MHVAKEQVPIRIETRGAVARQQTGFGDVSGYGVLGAEYFSLAAGTDLTPLLAGLRDGLCHSPHWGYLIQGELTVIYRDKSEEVVRGGDLFFWPAGHTVKVGALDAEIILFSPEHEHGEVFEHIARKLDG